MDEWTSTVRQQPKAYTVTLAPYAIALGPELPNIIDFEHQRDVLIRCAKLWSQTLDKLNLIDYILDPDHILSSTADRHHHQHLPASGTTISVLSEITVTTTRNLTTDPIPGWGAWPGGASGLESIAVLRID
jgi:hypothetical protein